MKNNTSNYLSTRALSLISIFILFGCSEQESKSTIEVVIQKKDFIVKIPTEGELEAVTATSIGMPGSVRTPQVLEWLAEENTLVKKGQVVARFDGRKFRHQSSQEQIEIDKANIGIDTKEKELFNEKNEIVSSSQLIVEELQMSKRFNVDDLQVYSRNEIIDALRNQSYLFAKENYTQWRGDSHEKKSTSELQLLSLKKKQHDIKLQTYQSSLQTLEVLAPHDGLFVLKKNRRGEKPHIGDTLFPGMKLASLPDLSKLQAKVFILESETAGVKVGQRVEIILDAYQDEIILGELTTLDAIAKTRNRGNPTKYFEAIVSIDSKKLDHWRPGSQLKATIYVSEKPQAISIPSQAMYTDGDKYYVDLKDGSDWIKREIQIGLRNTAKTEILKGLLEGDIISLFDQQRIKQQGEKYGIH